MNLLPIIYSSLLIFSTVAVIVISTSFILYKIKNNSRSRINHDSTFVLRRPAGLATATNKIVLQNSAAKSPSKVAHSNRNKISSIKNSKSNSRLRTRTTKSTYAKSPNRNSDSFRRERRYQVLKSFDREIYGENFNNSINSRGLNSQYYSSRQYGESSYYVGNQSQFL